MLNHSFERLKMWKVSPALFVLYYVCLMSVSYYVCVVSYRDDRFVLECDPSGNNAHAAEIKNVAQSLFLTCLLYTYDVAEV